LSSVYPENTLLAVTKAMDVSDLVEIDVMFSKDGHVVVIHDDSVDRTTDCTGPVSSFTLAELQAMDAGSHKEAAFAGERIPSLAETLDLFVGPGKNKSGAKLLVELKFRWFSWRAGWVVEYAGLAQRVVELVQAKGAHDVVVVQSFVGRCARNNAPPAIRTSHGTKRSSGPSMRFLGVTLGTRRTLTVPLRARPTSCMCALH
jgi:glycerophosphoryl diester phosphodiesterase